MSLSALCAGLAHQARQRFALAAEVVHVDSTSFSVEGAYEAEEEEETNEALIRITYGYSRDHRADHKQWQLSLATTTSGVPQGLQVLDGKPATGFIMVLCLLVYRLAEYRIRQRLEATNSTVPDQLKRPTQSPTLRWLFQCFEGISLVLMQREERIEAVQVTGLTDLHQLILRLLGPAYANIMTRVLGGAGTRACSKGALPVGA